MPVNSAAILGVLVGFLVVGTIGIYVGGQFVAATNASYGGQVDPQFATITQTFEMGSTILKVMVVVCIAAILFVLLQQVGLVPGGRRNPRYDYDQPARYDPAPQQQARIPILGAERGPEQQTGSTGEVQEEEKKPEKRDRYRAVKV